MTLWSSCRQIIIPLEREERGGVAAGGRSGLDTKPIATPAAKAANESSVITGTGGRGAPAPPGASPAMAWGILPVLF
jgi:hypothetical protein